MLPFFFSFWDFIEINNLMQKKGGEKEKETRKKIGKLSYVFFLFLKKSIIWLNHDHCNFFFKISK